MFTYEEIHQGVKSLGLNLTEKELASLQSGNLVLLEQRRLSEIGSIFILAAALCPLNSDQKRKTPLFLDIYASEQPASNQQGIPVYCWSKKPSERACLYLFLANGIPSCQIVVTFCQLPEEITS